jgi:hypothetical protein
MSEGQEALEPVLTGGATTKTAISIKEAHM